MKKILYVLVCAAMLTGCGVQDVMETVTDDNVTPVMAQIQQVQVTLPDDAAVATLESADAGKLYLCDGYVVTVQTMEAGDLDRTLRQCTGFSREHLTVMETVKSEIKRYDCVWSAAGEGGDQVARAAILDDGSYHYVVTVMAGFESAGELAKTWQEILDSIALNRID
ncbi:MAG: hypothetical protein IKC95_06630 [Oscillospiraceae bacterium]|nr:hypothetical protein [Oscillospiraceae bacterium]